ncbi:UDP-N-acetylmuramoyl-tripeptide--D-alanyl-D-alanine ligase [Robertmurraya yapensis]|uniref:UDP-N-acetylmuramoyl-tripeptide--D-alanyl-D-alanine ligase n=1 Tax=Bacillus yapensis TaxID=2492960 RepID=A0A431WER2_9BACI|nr:UDP-N-acetylmuramoyl-tripeptide--D-alanyl-D-alanine ligase [Bacillus yapensis]RTR34013.1 UDP-N-acetylmuramoyl-tripeptide--D-alanyl-D-alanine ligase [Bacillus yapensis]TKS97331.1 UDP-N-acetylmuramoyl-tripeptide--D-alanyl-D-alanine ligase [Bacillus yapensis]
MIKRSLKAIKVMINGEGLEEKFESVMVEGVSIDSRTVKKGNLFIPIIRIKDGHNYVLEAMKNGAIAALWEKNRSNPPKDIPLIFVDNTLLALQSLASSYRNQLSIKVIGITGSNGKTTTKDMVNSIVSTSFNVHKTRGNLNSQIGLPLTILEVSEDDEIVVLEMGMSERGQIEQLSKIAQPDIAIITMIGLSHIATLGSREEIAKAKLEILAGLKENGLFIFYGDEPLLNEVKYTYNTSRIRFITFGVSTDNDIYASSVFEESGEYKFFINNRNASLYTVPLMGKHNVQNALAAISVGKELGIKEENIVSGLKNLTITEMRMQKLISKSGYTIINDAWNASPNSVTAAIEAFQELRHYNKKIIVLGDMLELGAKEEDYHKEIGQIIDPDRIDYLITYGPLSKHTANEAKKTFGKERVKHFTDKKEIVELIKDITMENDIILVKGSRGMALEEIVNLLL